MIIRRGDIVLVKLNPVLGSEQGKTRPCLIIQNDIGNATSPTTIVAAITSATEKEYPFTVFLPKGEANLPKDSSVMLNQIRTVSVADRIITKIGGVSPANMAKIDQAIKISLALD
ncbi:MAG: type II toxin-antitoxin system PemK/MazF family toxin [Candidatus Diapherotrites archaeon]|nr:type II toxin-antitoxin system PemK/MazF family toxin [Candidatus Diapherotrites archaeon]